jgi:K+-sensing histidine kinase KdpD
MNACSAELAAAGVRVHFVRAERLPLVYVDGRQIEKVITTLLSRPELCAPGRASDITLTTSHGQSPEDPLAIDIEAEGASLDRDDEAAVWSGGVAASQRVMAAHGGSLTVEQRTGGLRIRLELPVAMRDAAAETRREKAERPPGRAAASPGR